MRNLTMTQPCEPKLAAEIQDEPSPFIVEFFLVQGIGFRCMAYRDHDGKWHRAMDNEELQGPIAVLE